MATASPCSPGPPHARDPCQAPLSATSCLQGPSQVSPIQEAIGPLLAHASLPPWAPARSVPPHLQPVPPAPVQPLHFRPCCTGAAHPRSQRGPAPLWTGAEPHRAVPAPRVALPGAHCPGATLTPAWEAPWPALAVVHTAELLLTLRDAGDRVPQVRDPGTLSPIASHGPRPQGRAEGRTPGLCLLNACPPAPALPAPLGRSPASGSQ